MFSQIKYMLIISLIVGIFPLAGESVVKNYIVIIFHRKSIAGCVSVGCGIKRDIETYIGAGSVKREPVKSKRVAGNGNLNRRVLSKADINLRSLRHDLRRVAFHGKLIIKHLRIAKSIGIFMEITFNCCWPILLRMKTYRPKKLK